jgi:DNA-directed RNA polymerase subunit RPC12/RpoP
MAECPRCNTKLGMKVRCANGWCVEKVHYLCDDCWRLVESVDSPCTFLVWCSEECYNLKIAQEDFYAPMPHREFGAICGCSISEVLEGLEFICGGA